MAGAAHMLVSIVVAFGHGSVIGKNHELPWNLPSDLARFKKITDGGSLIMGCSTFFSIIARNGQPHLNCENIVLTQNNRESVRDKGGIPVSSVQQALASARSSNRIFVIGGAEIYKLFMPLANWAYITRVSCRTKGDAHFPENAFKGWKVGDRADFKRVRMSRQHPGDSHDSEFYIFRRP